MALSDLTFAADGLVLYDFSASDVVKLNCPANSQSLISANNYAAIKVLLELNTDKVKIVQSAQTIQAVVDLCPVAAGSLKTGFTNPYVVKVPPGHEKECYSLVRNAADTASDKRNVKVIFENNPEGIFQIDSLFDCESLTGWTASKGTVELNESEAIEGKYCWKLHSDAGAGSAYDILMSKTSSWDFSEYQGILLNISWNASQNKGLKIIFRDSNSDENTIWFPKNSDSWGQWDHQYVYVPLYPTGSGVETTVDFSDITQIRLWIDRVAGYEEEMDVYIDNIRLIRTMPAKTLVLRFDDMNQAQFDYRNALEERGLVGNYALPHWHLLGQGSYMSKDNCLRMAKAGHVFVNHTKDHPVTEALVTDPAYMRTQIESTNRWFRQQGLTKGQQFYIGPGNKSSQYINELLRSLGMRQVDGESAGFPAYTTGFNLTAPFTPTGEMQNFVAATEMGGIIVWYCHDIASEAVFNDYLDYVESHFSHIITYPEIASKLPAEMAIGDYQGGILPLSKTLLMTEDYELWCADCDTLFADPGGANRNIIPVHEYESGFRLIVVNTADAVETLTFDPTFSAAGNHDAVAHDTIMTDSGESWTVGRLIGRTINNTPDGSSGTITANTATTVTAVLSGGTSNDWQNGEAYTITPAGLNQAVGQDQRATFVYDGEGCWNIVNLYDKTP